METLVEEKVSVIEQEEWMGIRENLAQLLLRHPWAWTSTSSSLRVAIVLVSRVFEKELRQQNKTHGNAPSLVQVPYALHHWVHPLWLQKTLIFWNQTVRGNKKSSISTVKVIRSLTLPFFSFLLILSSPLLIYQCLGNNFRRLCIFPSHPHPLPTQYTVHSSCMLVHSLHKFHLHFLY